MNVYFTVVMKKKRDVIKSYILPCALLIVLCCFLVIQILSVKSLFQQELQRLRYEIQRNTLNTSAMIKDELTLLPILARSKESEENKVLEKITRDIHFWEDNAVSSSLFSQIWLFTSSNEDNWFFWQGDKFEAVDAVTDERVVNFEYKEKISQIAKNIKDESYISYVTTDDGNDFLLSPVIIGNESLYMLCEIDTQDFALNVIPVFIEKCFQNVEVYNMRIIDIMSEKVIYQTDSSLDSSVFEQPIVSWLIMSSSDDKEHIHISMLDEEQTFTIETFAEQPDFALSIFRNRTERSGFDEKQSTIFNIQSTSENPPEMINRGGLLMQVVHKNGSVLKAAWMSTFVNSFISVMVFIILLLGILLLQKNLRKAEKLALRQQEFIATVTHELKTPIAVVSSASQNMIDGIVKTPEKIMQYGTMMHKESNRLKTTIDFFLLYGKLNSGVALRFSSVNFTRTLKETLSVNETFFNQNGFTVEEKYPDEELYVFGDKTAIVCVFQNMIDNAIKHAATGKYLGVFLDVNDVSVSGSYLRTLVLKFVDKGEGITKNERSKIFEPFERGRKAWENQIEGSGVGLNLVRRIMLLHKGNVELESSNEKGSIFSIEMPLL